MTRQIRFALALCAFFVVAIGLSACGGGVPGNAVVKVGDTSIKTSTFNHWLNIAAVSSAAQTNPASNGQPAKANIPDAPDFKNCIAEKKKTAPKPAKGQPEPTDADFKAQCAQQYNGLKNQVMEFLVREQWLEGEAARDGVKVSDQEVQKQLEQAKQQAFPKPSDYAKFLTQSGMTEADLLFRQRSQVLENKISQKVTKASTTVTPAQIAAYYKKNMNQFSQPERRDLLIVLTKTQGKAQQALAALKSGQPFSKVASKFSIDASSKSQGGKLPGVAKGQQEPGFDKAIFAAKKGKLQGPVKTQFGYYVFEVSKVTAPIVQSQSQATPTIKQILQGQNQRHVLDKFGKDYRKRWKAKTSCRGGYVVQDCKNYKAPKGGAGTAPPGAQTVPAQPQQPTTAPPAQSTTTTGK